MIPITENEVLSFMRLAERRIISASITPSSFTPEHFKQTLNAKVRVIRFLDSQAKGGIQLPREVQHGREKYEVEIGTQQSKEERILTLVHEAVHLHCGWFPFLYDLGIRRYTYLEGKVETIARGSFDFYRGDYNNLYRELLSSHLTSVHFPLIRIVGDLS